MFKSTLIGMVALVALCAATAGIVQASEKPLPPTAAYHGRLIGPIGSGYFEYAEWLDVNGVLVQRLHIVVRDYEPLVSMPVRISRIGVGTLTTDKAGFVDATFWNPPMSMPQMRPDSVLIVGDLTGYVKK